MYDLGMFIRYLVSITQVLQYQPINLPTTRAQAFLMDYPQGETGHNPPRGPSADW
jgi:hypothetical protein